MRELIVPFSCVVRSYGQALARRLVFVVMLRDPIQRVVSEFEFLRNHHFAAAQQHRSFLLWLDYDRYTRHQFNQPLICLPIYHMPLFIGLFVVTYSPVG